MLWLMCSYFPPKIQVNVTDFPFNAKMSLGVEMIVCTATTALPEMEIWVNIAWHIKKIYMFNMDLVFEIGTFT